MQNINNLDSSLKKERSQSFVRIAVASIVLVTLLGLNLSKQHETGSQLQVSVNLVGYFWLFACVWALYVWKRQYSTSLLRYFALMIDIGATTAAMCFADSLGALFYPVYLWIIIGHGIRFGAGALISATISGVAGFFIAIALTPYWQQNFLNATGLVVGLLVIPSYVLVLLRRYDKINDLLKDELKKTYHAANHDALTGLANRYQFYSHLERDIGFTKHHGGFVAVLVIDLDGFKSVNDTLGHQAGDQALKEIAKRLQKSSRTIDLTARLGGDEFAIILSKVNKQEDVFTPAKRIIEAIEEPIVIQNREHKLSASVGITIYPVDGQTADELIHNSDLAMYEVKRRGKRGYLCFSDLPLIAQDTNNQVSALAIK